MKLEYFVTAETSVKKLGKTADGIWLVHPNYLCTFTTMFENCMLEKVAAVTNQVAYLRLL